MTCWYARQDKAWLRDPDGNPWEVVLDEMQEELVADRRSAPCCAG